MMKYLPPSMRSQAGCVTILRALPLPSASSHSPQQNALLAALPAADFERLQPALELVPLPLRSTVFEAGDTPRYAVFPTTSVVSFMSITENGSTGDIAVVGNDGVVGIALFMGGGSTTSQAMVQTAGFGYRLNASVLKTEFNRSGEFTRLLLRYTQALMTQMAQTAVCNRHHTVEQRLCRRLLMSWDRLPSNELVLTQELIANMLGVRREGITEAAGKLQAVGAIHYSRGRITILDRSRLEAHCCECYSAVKREYDRLLPHSAQKIPSAIRSILYQPAPQLASARLAQ